MCGTLMLLHLRFVLLLLFHQVVAVAARNLSNAQEFGKKHNIPQTYGSYEELANDPNIGESEQELLPLFFLEQF